MAETLGRYLMTLRTARKLTLRDVEERTAKAVSNAYLSQIENDKIGQPSPNILIELAKLYGVEYEKLMEMAGYAAPRKDRKAAGDNGVLRGLAVTPEEEAELAEYLRFIRGKRR